MISEADALKRILAHPWLGAVERIPLAAALGRFIAVEVVATVPNPRFDVSSMDGYAIRAGECGSVLRIEGEQPAGLDRGLTLDPGSAIRIFTGAPIPAGADAVVMQEDVRVGEEDGNPVLKCIEPVEVGENIRRAGADLCKGQRLFSKGDALTPARLALLASQGVGEAMVHVGPRVAVLTTGDELVEAGAELLPGQIFNSNGVMLRALLMEMGISAVTVSHCSDDFEETRSEIENLTSNHDALIVIGGVSVGDHDQVKPALKAVGIEPEIWRVKVKPGKPFLFAHRDAPQPLRIFGLPGNPVSAFVTFHLFVKPALLGMMGAGEVGGDFVLAECTQDLVNAGDRPHYVRGCIEDAKFTPFGIQQSHAIRGLSQANGLLRLDMGEVVTAGTSKRVMWV